MMHSSRRFIPYNSGFRFVILTSAILVFVLIVSGGVVSATNSAGACPDWPTCLGKWTPPFNQSPLIDYAHRAITLSAAPFLFASAMLAWKERRRSMLILASTIIALVLFIVQIGLGALVARSALSGIRPWLTPIHLMLSLFTLTTTLVASALTFYPVGITLKFLSPFSRLSLASVGMMLLLLVSGATAKVVGVDAACASWPLCDAASLLTHFHAWFHLGHRLVVAASALVMLILFIQAWRTQRSQTPILVATTAATTLFFAQALLGAKMVEGFPAYLLGLHQVTATAVWGALVIQLVAVGAAARSTADERNEAASAVGRNGLARDLLMLTKPIVVALLLVTTFAGMVIGAQAWPPFSLAFWTLLGGFLAAGGSGAINQFIDREDDLRMQRTQKRPIPSGRLTPAEGLAFGVGIALASFYLMTAMVNFLAALLSLAGIIYYVLLYSIFLKKTTVQNIVIGGGAGAIPPLVGWAAATGGLNVPALFLFAIVFMWTPPHFWALALVRRNDYARAGVPMLPVVRGEVETRWQIFLYTVELVVITLLLPLFGLGGGVYLVGAAMLGGWLLLAAWKVWKTGGNKAAWKMYRFSSMYLAFLFVVLMIDRLI